MRQTLILLAKGLSLGVLIGSLLMILVSCSNSTSIADDVTHKLSKYLTDQAELIPDQQERNLVEYIKVLREKQDLHIFILVKHSIEDSLEEFTNRVFNATSIGGPTNRGILIVLINSTRQIRVEVSKNLEGDLPDSVVNDSIKAAKSSLSRGDFVNGLKTIITFLSIRVK